MILSLIINQKQTVGGNYFFKHIDTLYHYFRFLIHWVGALEITNKIKPNSLWIRLAFLPAIVLLFLSVACGTDATPTGVTKTPAEPSQSIQTSASPKINVQATTTVLADMVRVIGGDMVESTSIVPAGADVHIYQVSPSQRIAISKARLLVSNGLGLDDFLNSELDNSNRSDVVHVVASQGLTPEALEEMSLSANGMDSEHHGEELAEKVEHLIHEAEEGVITPEEAVEHIEELLGGHGDLEDGHGHDEEGLEEKLKEIIHEVEDGHFTAESAIESMEQVIEQHHGEELAEKVEHLIHETEQGAITPEEAVERIEELLGGHGDL